ncbi:leucyl aminopeptidase [candidate division KSB1 bacterium 4484_188]|nr:MAG: leucyl aminopeptidase [candidate division KSB1 bacterium 4484_188]
MDKLQKAAHIAVKDCMAVSGNETVLVITDRLRHKTGYAIYEAAQELGKEAFLLEMKEREINGQEPPEAVAELMKMVNVVICPTTKSLTHTDARREACKAGARVGTLPGITEDMMIRTMSADYNRIARLTYKVSEILDRGEIAHLTTPLGTDITIPIKGIKSIPSTGLITKPGTYGNLPSGESFLMPEEGKSNGVFFVDGSLAGIGRIQGPPVKIRVENGFAVEITGGEQAETFRKMVESIGRDARNLAELGVGTNYMAQITGEILEDEKVAGTVHLALGNNVSMGGTFNVGFHVDGIMTRPTLKIDDTLILDEGKLLVK